MHTRHFSRRYKLLKVNSCVWKTVLRTAIKYIKIAFLDQSTTKPWRQVFAYVSSPQYLAYCQAIHFCKRINLQTSVIVKCSGPSGEQCSLLSGPIFTLAEDRVAPSRTIFLLPEQLLLFYNSYSSWHFGSWPHCSFFDLQGKKCEVEHSQIPFNSEFNIPQQHASGGNTYSPRSILIIRHLPCIDSQGNAMPTLEGHLWVSYCSVLSTQEVERDSGVGILSWRFPQVRGCDPSPEHLLCTVSF